MLVEWSVRLKVTCVTKCSTPRSAKWSAVSLPGNIVTGMLHVTAMTNIFYQCRFIFFTVPMAVSGVLSPGVKPGRGVKLTTHPHIVPRLRMCRSYTSSPPMRLHGV
jgi:hypothetical protein